MIFVCGTPRSGTTLTAEILGRHPKIFASGELHFYDEFNEADFCELSDRQNSIRKLEKLFEKFSQFEDQARISTNLEFVFSFLSEAKSANEVIDAFMSAQARLENKSIWANSTPRDIFHSERILQDFPNAKIVVCLRHPKDFVASYKNRYRTTYQNNRLRLKDVYHPVSAIALWYSTLKRAKKIAGERPNNVFILKYEDLVMESKDAVQRLCAFLDVEFRESMLGVKSENSSFDSQATAGIFSTSVGQGEQWLSKKEVSLVEFIMAFGVAGHFGYGTRFRIENAFVAMGMFPSAVMHLRKLAKLSANNGRRENFFWYILKRLKS